ncbi:MAG: rhomboid family intramembrane serine protease [Proteobacteria bacterium]|jgi:membrane associated rhomboid family serine protease|nr:rhomboid family intramembrane serine protease [Pseudomonadota bacterium]
MPRARRTILSPWPFTRAVKIILIVNAAVWLTTVVVGRWAGITAPFEHLALTPSRVLPGLELWQPFTYMWLHAPNEVSHILFNSLFLWMFGGTLEQGWGARGFVNFYLLCGVGAGLVVLAAGALFYPDAATVGASGAIYGLVAAWVITDPNRIVWVFGLFPIKGKWFALLPIGYAALDFLVGGTATSHAAHLGGLAIGALLTTGLWRPSRLASRIRLWRMRRRLKVLEGDGSQRKPPPPGGYWH